MKKLESAYNIKPHLLEKYNRPISFLVLFLMLVSSFGLLYAEVVYKISIPLILVAIVLMCSIVGMIFFVGSCINCCKYAGIKKIVLFIRNLFVNPFLKKEKLSPKDRSVIEEVNGQYGLGIIIILVIFDIALIVKVIEEIIAGGDKTRECVLQLVIMMVITVIAKIILKFNETRLNAGRYYSLQYGTVVTKNKWYEAFGRSGARYWYTADVKLNNGKIYEGVVYNETHYKKLKPGHSKCIVYGITGTCVHILEVDRNL